MRSEIKGYLEVLAGFAVMLLASNWAHHMYMHSADHSHPWYEWTLMVAFFSVGLFLAFPQRAPKILGGLLDLYQRFRDRGENPDA